MIYESCLFISLICSAPPEHGVGGHESGRFRRSSSDRRTIAEGLYTLFRPDISVANVGVPSFSHSIGGRVTDHNYLPMFLCDLTLVCFVKQTSVGTLKDQVILSLVLYD